MSQQQLRTIPETAAQLGLSESSVWVLIRGDDPELASVPIKTGKGDGKRAARRVEQSEIDAYIARNRVGTPRAAAVS